MNYNEALNALNLTNLSDRRAHLCQFYIDRLPLHRFPYSLLKGDSKFTCYLFALKIMTSALT